MLTALSANSRFPKGCPKMSAAVHIIINAIADPKPIHAFNIVERNTITVTARIVTRSSIFLVRCPETPNLPRIQQYSNKAQLLHFSSVLEINQATARKEYSSLTVVYILSTPQTNYKPSNEKKEAKPGRQPNVSAVDLNSANQG